MMGRIPCPPNYLKHKARDPELFVRYVRGFVANNYKGEKVVGVQTDELGACYILTIPDYDAQRAVVSGKGKNKTVKMEPMYTVPIEAYLNENDIEYLKQRGMDKYGNKISEK